MRQHKYQLIRVHVPKPGASVRFTGETDQSFDRLAGIFVAMPDAVKEMGAALGLKIGGQEVFDEDHDVRLITCGREVSPNEKFFQFPEHIEAGGSSIEGRLVDAANTQEGYPYEARIILYLVSES